MKKYQRSNPRYPDQHKDILNIAAVPWLEKRIKKVLKQGKKKRIAKYKNIDPFAFRIEYPSVFARSKGYFRSTIVSRDNGLCFPDPKIPFVTFSDYLSSIDSDAIVFPEEFIDIGDLDTFETVVINIETFPETFRYIVVNYTKTTGPGIALLVLGASHEFDLNDIYTQIFKEYTLQELSATWKEKGDEGYPTEKQDATEYYAIGTLTVKDSVFKGRSVTLDIFDLQHVKEIITYHPFIFDGYYRYDGTKVYNGTRTY